MNTMISITPRPGVGPVQLPAQLGATAPSISSSAMLVELSIAVWSGRKKDRGASEQVTRDNHAKSGVVSVNKKLLGDCAELEAVSKYVQSVRGVHRDLTMPWSDLGLRLLPTAQFFKYQETISAAEVEFERLVKVFLDAYSWEVAQAATRLGDLFNHDEYPTLESIASKFSFRKSFTPLPDTGDWRVDLDATAKKALHAEYEQYYSTQLKGAMDDLWTRLRDTLTTLVGQLEPTAPGEKARRIYDSVVDRAKELVDMMGTCNITGDKQMADMQAQLAAALDGTNAEALRSDAAYKADTKRKLDAAIAALPGLGF